MRSNSGFLPKHEGGQHDFLMFCGALDTVRHMIFVPVVISNPRDFHNSTPKPGIVPRVEDAMLTAPEHLEPHQPRLIPTSRLQADRWNFQTIFQPRPSRDRYHALLLLTKGILFSRSDYFRGQMPGTFHRRGMSRLHAEETGQYYQLLTDCLTVLETHVSPHLITRGQII